MNLGWIYRRVHSRTTPSNSHWNQGGRSKGTISILTETFRCWAQGTKAEATKGHIQPQYGERGSQQPNGHSAQLAHSRSRLESPRCLATEGRAKWEWGKSRQPGSDLPSPCAQLSLITAKLGTHSCPRQSRGQALMKEKSFNKAHTGMCHWEKKKWAAPFLPLPFPQLLPLGLLGLNTNHTGKKEAQGKPL